MSIYAGDSWDGWAGQLLGSAVGGVLGVTAALVAIWLTRRNDQQRLFNELALRGAEEIARGLSQFIRLWEKTPTIMPDTWHNTLYAKHIDFYVEMVVQSAVIKDPQLVDSLTEYDQVMKDTFARSQELMNRITRYSGYRNTPEYWEQHDGTLRKFDDILRSASFLMIDIVNEWRKGMRFPVKIAGFAADRATLERLTAEHAPTSDRAAT